LGIDKFLRVAWHQDALNGEADFDIDRNNVQLHLYRPTKIGAFSEELENGLRQQSIRSERDVLELVFRHGVRREHAKPVLDQLKRAGVIECSFRVPQVDGFETPRPITHPPQGSLL
jgi:hypothetical protein